MKAANGIALGLLLSASAAQATPVLVQMSDEHWDVGGEASWDAEDGVPILRLGPAAGQPLKGGEADLKGVDFATGVIEFDIKLVGERDFAGPAFHMEDLGTKPSVYYLPPVNRNFPYENGVENQKEADKKENSFK